MNRTWIGIGLLLAPAVLAADWPHWRGPLATGEAPDGKPPVEWSEEKNVRFKVALPGAGLGTPLVLGDRIYLTTAIPTTEKSDEKVVKQALDGMPAWMRERGVLPEKVVRFVVMALDREDGSTVWQTEVRRAAPHEGTHGDGSWAAASLATDGEMLIAHFGSYGTFGLDTEGEVVWERDLGDMTTRHGFGEGTSPAVHGETVIVKWDHEGPSFIAALDKKTGKTRWQVDRDEVTSWSTPIVVDVGGKPQVIASATGATRGYDLATGEVVWQASGMTINAIPTPIPHEDRVFVASGCRGNMLQAIDLAGARGELNGKPALAWSVEKDTPYVPSPVLYDGRLYMLKQTKGILTVLDANSGKLLYGPHRLKGLTGVYASPVAADGRIYIVGRDGGAVVLKHGKEPRVLAVNRLDDRFDASPAIAGDELFLRGRKHLYCIAEKRK